VNVTNYASGVEAARSGEHTYTVSVGWDGLPTECTCPADEYQPGPANTSWPSLAVERSSTGPCTATPIRRPTSTRTRRSRGGESSGIDELRATPHPPTMSAKRRILT
jgi:hypothetical protein